MLPVLLASSGEEQITDFSQGELIWNEGSREVPWSRGGMGMELMERVVCGCCIVFRCRGW